LTRFFASVHFGEGGAIWTLQWLALALTPGLGATRVRRLVEHFGNVAATFRTSLTELEATGMLATSAQAIATGKSWELAQEEKIRANGVGATIIALDDAAYPAQLKQIYAPPPILCIRGNVHCDLGRHSGRNSPKPRGLGWRRAVPMHRNRGKPHLYPRDRRSFPRARAAFTPFFGLTSRSTLMTS
jgi:hypothetical protein